MSEQTELIEAGGMELMFRYLTPEDLPKLLDLYAEEQWGELSFCLLELLECYPESFLGAFGPDRELISHVALFNSTDEVSYLTAFITRSKYRRLGVGFPVFEKAIELARHRRVVLDSVPGMSSTYEKRGFVIQFNFCKMQGALSPCYESSAPSCQKIPKVFIQPVTEDNTSRICHYDRKISGIDRELFIRKVLLKSTTQATCAVTAQNVVVGLLVLHTVDSGHSNVFSFYADDLNIAKLLLQDVIAGQTTPMSLRGLFVPQVNPDSMKLFSMFGLKQDPADVRCPRMSNRNLADGLHWCKVFALCCFGYSYV